MKVGVLALQGASTRHGAMLARLGAEVVPIRGSDQLDDIAALVIPGGESTTISMLLESSGLFEPIAEKVRDGLPTLGTCAGMILLADNILDGRDDQRSFGVVDVDVRRNAFGRQVDSFEADLAVAGLRGEKFRAVFIRAPIVERVGSGVEVLATVAGTDGTERAVLCRQGPVYVAAFHPELGDDPRLHDLFLSTIPLEVS